MLPLENRRRLSRLVGAAASVVCLTAAASPAQERLAAVAASPAPHSLAAELDANVEIRFDRAVDPASLTAESVWAFGRWSGVVTGTLSLRDSARTVVLSPNRRFSAGETVTVYVSRDLRATDGSFLREGGFSFQFWTRSRGAGFNFQEIDRLTTRTSPQISTRAYGGFGSDLDGDGFLDLTIVNEDTNDLRTFLNRGDRSGRFRDFLRPTAVTENVPSPSEPSDFNRDGLIDVVVANTQDDSVSVFLGRGDGSFAPATHYPVGGEPRGVTVLDADGDGDVDIAATSFLNGTVTILSNDGGGAFVETEVFGTQLGERAIASGDMNDDGILDLVVGALTAGQIQVYTGNGDGSFELTSASPSGGEVWMLVLGDVDGDGNEDVAVVNSETGNGAVLMGDGFGGVSSPATVPAPDFPLATDLADLDGDGDLDWVTSSFFGDWVMWENDGRGSFSRFGAFTAPEAASCTLPMDIDNDGVLDLVLIDELSDEVFLMKNLAVLLADDFESGDANAWSRSRGAVLVAAPGLRGSAHALTVTLDSAGRKAYLQSNRPTREPNIVVSFDLDVSDLELNDQSVEILRLGSGKGQARLILEPFGGRVRARLLARERGGFRDVGHVKLPASRALRLQVEWSSASGPARRDGRAALLRKGKVKALAADLANHGKLVKRVRLGMPAGSSGAGRGSLAIDNYRSTR